MLRELVQKRRRLLIWLTTTSVIIGCCVLPAISIWHVYEDFFGPSQGNLIPLEELLVDQSAVQEWDTPNDTPDGATTAFGNDGIENTLRYFSMPSATWQHLWHYRTSRRASGAFKTEVASNKNLFSEIYSLPGGIDDSLISADEWDSFCAVSPVDFDLCYFTGRYEAYVTTLVVRVNQKIGGRVTADMFRQMVYAVDKRLVRAKQAPTPRS